MFREEFKKRILGKYKSVNKFCLDNGFRKSTVYDFLKGKTEMTTRYMEDMMLVLEWDLGDDNFFYPKLISLETIEYKGVIYRVGDIEEELEVEELLYNEEDEVLLIKYINSNGYYNLKKML